VVVFSKHASKPTCYINIEGETLEQVDLFMHVNSMVMAGVKSHQQIRRWIGISI